MRIDEYRKFDGLGLAELVATGDVTPRELVDCALAQATSIDPSINSIVRLMSEQADAQLTDTLRGPFAGVPFLIKDLSQDYAGLPTASGSRSLTDLPMPEHSTVVQRWLDAGLVIFGKTNTPEFGAKGITEPAVFGAARNPWDRSRTPGGSSGGSAAAVAAGIVPVAGANDGGGSIRIPASCCGLVGLKPGRGLVPSGPSFGEPMHGAAVHGVVSRSVRDTAAMLDVLAGGEPTSGYLPARPEGSFLSRLDTDPRPLRIGMYATTSVNPNPHPQAVAAMEAAAKMLTDLGHTVELLDAPPYDDASLNREFLLAWFTYLAWEMDEVKRKTGCGDDKFERDTRIMAALGRSASGVDYLEAVEGRHVHVRALATYFETFDLLLTPTLAELPPKIGAFDLAKPLELASELLLRSRTAGILRYTGIVDQMIDDNISWIPYTQLANVTGRPALSLPLHWTPEGLPMGAHFTAPLGGEELLVQLAGQLERAAPWAHRYDEIV
ncbi:Amidase, Asp-tRNAAsn/Glu-tRNAGln amidotransferase A subunit [Rhodococcus sp. AW25M09]|uniref:amidase n=1 Tax=Rhodococcus sp. AW25M09 TaxID=1268303 RepID=UPI0002ABF767|nr:amidase [Rhodococcus sp. AW25M09]CCQ14492.1 Amidase, Asp-tRNAAsn/Glu-tRNAGln amidotransferase A subunit [Rhodococcus sp. AW25M09]